MRIFFELKFKNIYFRIGGSASITSYILPETPNLYGAIIFCWYWMHKVSNSVLIQKNNGSLYDKINNNPEELKKFAEMIKMMS